VYCCTLERHTNSDNQALDAIPKFDVFEKDGAVYIKGEEDLIKSSKKTLDLSCKTQGAEKVLVIGG